MPVVALESEGVVLIYGRDERAVEAGNLLKEHLDVTVLIKPPAAISPPRSTEFPMWQRRDPRGEGYLGAFEVTVDDFAQPAPPRAAMLVVRADARNGAQSHCDIILDLSGGPPLFSAADLREGYLRADPDDPAAMLEAVLKARDLVGTFEKPRYVSLHRRSLRAFALAHRRDARAASTFAQRAPSVRPATMSPSIRTFARGCGQCAAVCPTGAASYALPPAGRAHAQAAHAAHRVSRRGRRTGVILFHDEAHGCAAGRRPGAARRRASRQRHSDSRSMR